MVSLPRAPTVTQILTDYRAFGVKHKKDAAVEDEVLHEVLDGLKRYFDATLGTMLLYRQERQQYADYVKRHPHAQMCDVYGAEHLLRLFVQMPQLIVHTQMDADSVVVLRD